MTPTKAVRAAHPKAPLRGDVADTHPELRDQSKQVRRSATDAWKRHGIVDSRHYANCTNALYMGLFGMTAKELKLRLGRNPRDGVVEADLLAIMLAEALARDHIASTGAYGPWQCAEVCRSKAQQVRSVLTSR